MNKTTLTDLDKKLQEIALLNWEQFVQLIGKDAILSAKSCLLRKQQYSYGEIQNKLGLTKEQVRYDCRTCETLP